MSLKVQVRQLASRPVLQPVWISLSKLCSAGMNYGGGQMVHDSGEKEALRFTVARTAPHTPFVLFDVGANQGDYLQSALAVLSSSVRAFSFEPQPYNIELLRRRFQNDSRVTLMPCALGSVPTTATLHFDYEGDPTASLGGSGGTAHSRSVPVTTIDIVCRDVGVDSIDMLKIDAEGHEMEILLGAQSMLAAGRIAAVQFEFGEPFVNTPWHFRDFYQLFAPDYRIFRILRSGLAELPHYTYDLEIYKLANFLCVRRNAFRHAA